MSTNYPVKLKITLRPVGQPWVKTGLEDHMQVKQLTALTTIEWEFDASDTVCLSVEHFNKHNHDHNTAVEIVGIEFFGINDPKFLWAGVYTPLYPEPWLSEQVQAPPREIPGQTYLGWNGTYRLTFTVPVFTWMHRTLDLGWIYQ